jgi:prepilin-type N-terminal cleavage/methylation domain-containing protein
MGRVRLEHRPTGRGFSLMEVLIALVVIAFGLYGILDLISNNQRASIRTERRAVATELCRAKMAEVQAGGFDAVAALWAKSPANAAASFVLPAERAPFTPPYASPTDQAYQWQARFDRDGPQAAVYNIEVRVFWQPIAGATADRPETYSVSVGGLLVKRGGTP